MFKLNKIAMSVGTALTLGYAATAAALPTPGAVAEGLLTLTSLRICAGDGVAAGGVAGACTLGAATFGSLIGTESATSAARVNGVSMSNQTLTGFLGVDFSSTTTVGAGFTPGVIIPVAPAVLGQYAGSTSISTGFSLAPAGAAVTLHAQTQLNSFGSDSSAGASQVLNTTFTVTLATTTTFELSFFGTKKLRAGLGQPGTSTDGDTSLSFAVFDVLGGGDAFNWDPSGSAGGISCAFGGSACVEHADAFNAQSGLTNVGLPLDLDPPGASGFFEAEVTLAPGIYTFNITASSEANATIFPVPEPHSLALLGLGLLGLGATARRKLRA